MEPGTKLGPYEVTEELAAINPNSSPSRQATRVETLDFGRTCPLLSRLRT
jgi:hypothetical protein